MPHLTAITWNYADLLRSASNGTFTSCYVYNAGGGRTRKVVVKGNIREERLYLGNYELYRKYVNNTLDTERQTLHIADDQHRFALIDRLTVNNGATLTTPTVAVRYQYDNHLGSASLELDQNAAIISYEEYHPFGTTSYRSGRTETEVALKRYKYVGKERDEETGLYYYGARYYAAWIARFVSVDPLQLKYPHYTPYQYAGNKPVSYIDLDGLEEEKKADETTVNQQIEESKDIKKAVNLYIIIKSEDELKRTYSNTEDGRMGTFQVITANDIEQATKKAIEYLGDSKAGTVVLDVHGISYTNINVKDKRELWLSPDLSNKEAVGAIEISNFFKKNQIENSNTEIQNDDIKALKELFSRTKEGGTFVLMACNIADDENLRTALFKLSEKRLTLYMNTDNTPSLVVKGKVQLWTGKTPLSVAKDKTIKVEEGWYRLTKEGTSPLRLLEGLKGSIYIDPRQGKEAINEL